MPPKASVPSEGSRSKIDGNHILLYSIILSTTDKSIDWKRVAAMNNIEIKAAQMRYYRLLPKLKDACSDSSETGESKKNENSSPTTPPKSPNVGATVGKADDAATPKKRGRPPKTNGDEPKKTRGRQGKANVDEEGEDKEKPKRGRKRKANAKEVNEEECDEQEGTNVDDIGENEKAELRVKQEGLRESKKMKPGHAGSSDTEEELSTYM